MKSRMGKFNALSLKVKVYGILTILFLVMVASGFIITHSLNEAEKDTELTNALGRQRMLTQAMSKSVLGYAMAKSRIKTIEHQTESLNNYITQMRGAYTQAIIKTAKKTKLGISMDPASEPHPAVPYPATFTRMVNQRVGENQDFSIDILSETPINPAKALKTKMDRDASEFLKNPSNNIFSKTFQENGQLYIGLYTADRATVPACASCHSALMGRKFQVGDMLGIRQFRLVFSKNIAVGNSELDANLEEYETAKKVFGLTLKAVKSGGEYPEDLAGKNLRTIDAVSDPIARQKIAEVENKFNEFTQTVALLVDSVVNSEPYREAQFHILQRSNDLRQLSGDLVQIYSGIAEQNQKNIRWAVNSSTVIVLLLLIGTAYFLSTVVIKPIRTVSAILSETAQGNLKQDQLPVTSGDEVGTLCLSFNNLLTGLQNFIKFSEEILNGSNQSEKFGLKGDFQRSLNRMLGQAKEKQKTDAKMAQVQSMMENSPTNVIFTGTDLKVQYLNPASTRTLKTIEQYLPIPVESIFGSSIDVFHKDPDRVRRIVSDPKNLPHKALIQVGPETLDLLVSAIYDQNNHYLGPMLTWEVVTQKLQGEREMARVMSMMENAPANVIYADLDLKVQYMNPASTKTLKTLEQHLPDRVDNLVGQSIDIFHKNPAHQRKILSDPKNLPHRAQIQLGPEKLDLLVSAIYDQDQNYMGSMVTWEVITQKLANEERAVELQERERSQAVELQDKVDSMLEVVNAAAEGDLTQEIPVKGNDAIGQMGEGLAKFLSKLRASMSELGATAQTLGSSSDQLNSTSGQMMKNAEDTSAQVGVASSAATEVSRNIQTVATAAEEMGASIKEIAQNANEAARVGESAVQVTEETNQTIAELGDSSSEIGEVVKVITSIAEQTNLLALNATIEAARAGEAGKGFAVVANEVKELANQTAKATEDISKKIQAIQTGTQGAVEAIGDISKIIVKINDFQGTIASAVEEQTATTGEISRNVSDAARGSNEIAQNIDGVAATAHNASEGATETKNAAEGLTSIATQIQNLVSQFKYEGNGIQNESSESLFSRIGGHQAVDAAVDVFYRKVLADDRVNHFFKGVSMEHQRKKQKVFLTFAFGGAPNYSGKNMREAHKHLKQQGLSESHFYAVLDNLEATLKELSVPEDLIQEALAIAKSTRKDVLNL
ncbi:MAG: hypothetical protein NPINA01_07820 [Nitrospinaceae bacterium]|nr:MAG: hypothetical protein NPINA01_07820 [Nitrospinaceae bacterium]